MDKFMLFVTIKENFYGAGIVCAIALLGVYKHRGFAFLVAAGIAIGLADAIGIIGMVSCSNSFSFPSNHAANSFAAATLLSLCFRNTTLLVFAFALIVCYSRVYLRVHYPSDVLGGATLGICMGYLGYRFYGRLLQYIKP